MRLERQFAHFIQQQCAAVRKFESSHLVRRGAREGAFFISEQLALEEIFRQRSAIQRDERTVGPGALVMDRTGDEFLSGSAFSREQDRDVALRHHVHQAVDALHGLAFADHLIEARPGFEAILELLVFDRQSVTLECFLDHEGNRSRSMGFVR